jgi:hypothetical protein
VSSTKKPSVIVMRSPSGIPPFLARGLLDMGCLRISEIVWIKSIRSSYAEEKKN